MEKTIGVIGTPINDYYPEENKELQDEIAENFLLISQVPFYKYATELFPHRKFHFPRRNKIMASISEATVIVEAGDTSGSLIQVRECFNQGKKLFILDSCFQNPKIKWPAKHEEKGAIRVKSTKDILKFL
ncbi:MAG: DNA-processing protein DprA [Oligoflexia bacterium]|nr:DNA-processing protein DprA [Oligoflexia bacterium]